MRSEPQGRPDRFALLSVMKRWLHKLLLGAATIAAIVWFSTGEATSPRKITKAQRQPEHPTHVSDLGRDVAAEDRAARVVPAVNRKDRPEMMRIEDLRNCGRATPSDAFQTLIWAAFTGDDDEVAATIVLADGDREIVEAWRAALPAEEQSKYAVIEKIPGLFATSIVLRRVTAIRIFEAIELAPDRVRLGVRIAKLDGTSADSVIQMKYGVRGWGWEIPTGFVSEWRNLPLKEKSETPNK